MCQQPRTVHRRWPSEEKARAFAAMTRRCNIATGESLPTTNPWPDLPFWQVLDLLAMSVAEEFAA